VPQKQKINLEKVMASLNTACPKCGCSITPDKIRRIDFQRIVCSECGERFIGERRKTSPLREEI
jgi:ribosomal protein S27AE